MPTLVTDYMGPSFTQLEYPRPQAFSDAKLHGLLAGRHPQSSDYPGPFAELHALSTGLVTACLNSQQASPMCLQVQHRQQSTAINFVAFTT